MQALGATVVVMEKFDAEQFLRAVERYRATAAQVVPTMSYGSKLPAAQRLNYDVSSLNASFTPAHRVRSRSNSR